MLMSANSFDTMSAQNAFWYVVTRVWKCLRTVHFCIQSFCMSKSILPSLGRKCRVLQGG